MIYTPPLTASILPGITREQRDHDRRDLGFKVREEMLPRELLYICRRGVLRRHGGRDHADPLGRQDQGRPRRRAARSPTAIQQAFFDIINGRVPDRHDWLTFVYPASR